MRKRDEYISGPHDFWVHFAFGFVLGALVSTWSSVWLFDSPEAILVTSALGTLIIAYCCGRWGDSAWYWLIKHLPWIQ